MILRPYQDAGATWLSRRKAALLADQQRLGKTPQAIVALDRGEAARTLIVCPASVVPNWHNEYAVWARPGYRQVHVTSYDQLARNVKGLPAFDVAIFDEAHYLKNPAAKRTLAALRDVKAERWWFLTGTPQPNHIGEVWTLAYKCGATRLSYDAWCRRYCTYATRRFKVKGRTLTREIITGTDVTKRDEIRAILDTFMLRRLQSEVDLPPLDIQTLVVETGLPDGLFAALEAVAEGPVEDPSVAAARRELGRAKVKPVVAVLADELANDAYAKVVVFAIHRDVVTELRAGLREFEPAILVGDTPRAARQRAIDRFQSDPACRVFIGNVEAAGTGIRLDAASQVVMLEPDWRPGVNAQAMMRPLMPDNPVTVRFIASTNRLDRHITATVRRKAEQTAAIFS